jgi:GT2 family glycosyltransferase/glycosyltransferase involved in cell wall biosynthesis
MSNKLLTKLKSLIPKSCKPVAKSIAKSLLNKFKSDKQLNSELAQIWNPRNIKLFFENDARKKLNYFLNSNCELDLNCHSDGKVSIIIPVFNRAELTFQCLRSLSLGSNKIKEVILFDNLSTDETNLLSKKIRGLTYFRNSSQMHYLESCNTSAELCSAEFLLFLNNDTELMPEAIDKALEVFESSSQIGAVGAKLIFPDGSLQEAGSVFFKNGICAGYGRGEDPNSPEFQFRRVVDYCSGAFLLTPKNLFDSCGRFSLEYLPAYYEEADYCAQLQQKGLKVMYEPRAVVQHWEFASSSAQENAISLQNKNRLIFLKRNKLLLDTKFAAPEPESRQSVMLRARSAASGEKRILIIDERLPRVSYGAGYPRANSIVKALLSLGWKISIYPAIFVEDNESISEIYKDVPREVEVLATGTWGPDNLKRFLKERKNFYHAIFISRPTTMKKLRQLCEQESDLIDFSKVIYDAEAIFAIREEIQARVLNQTVNRAVLQDNMAKELALAKGVKVITAVSESEAKQFRDYTKTQVKVIGHAIDSREHITNNSNLNREGLLFVGAIHGDGGPNYDSIEWFCTHVLPELRRNGFADRLYIVGRNHSTGLLKFASLGVEFVGQVDSLEEWFDRCRVFIAPTRFSAGIPLKVIEAAANMLPTVISRLAAEQLGWIDNDQCLVAESAGEFCDKILELYNSQELQEQVCSSAKKYVEERHSFEHMKVALSEALDLIVMEL